jgi:hypothetical protein
VRVTQYPRVHQREKAGKPQIRDYNHHSEQQNQRVEIDSFVGFIQGEDSAGHHETRTD